MACVWMCTETWVGVVQLREGG